MSAALVAAQLLNHEHPPDHDPDELAGDLMNISHAKAVAAHLDLAPRLDVSYDLLDHDELQMVVEGEEDDVVEFLSRCGSEGVWIKAVRGNDESEFRLVTNPERAASEHDL